MLLREAAALQTGMQYLHSYEAASLTSLDASPSHDRRFCGCPSIDIYDTTVSERFALMRVGLIASTVKYPYHGLKAAWLSIISGGSWGACVIAPIFLKYLCYHVTSRNAAHG